MHLDDKTISDIAGQLGLKGNLPIHTEDVKRLEGKSDAELEREIIKLREQLAARGVTRPRQAAILRSLLPMMDEKQKARLRNVIELIERY